MIAQDTMPLPLLSADDRQKIEDGDWPARPLIEAECLKRDVPFPLVIREHSHTVVTPPPPPAAPEPPDTLRLIEMQKHQNRSEALVIALAWSGSVLFCGLIVRALLRAVA
jgi:hypothetical protein